MSKRFLQFGNARTGERAENPGKVDVSGKGEREVEKIERGMLMRCNTDAGWYVDDVIEP